MHSVSSLVEASNMADDCPLTHTLMFLKNKRAGSVPNLNFLQNRPPSYDHFDQPNQVLGRKNRNSYRPPEINKGESPKCCSYCKKKVTFFQNFLKRND